MACLLNDLVFKRIQVNDFSKTSTNEQLADLASCDVDIWLLDQL